MCEQSRWSFSRIESSQLRARQLLVHYRLGPDPGALSALPLVAVNREDGGNHGASKRRTPEGSAPPIKGLPPPRSACQRRRSKVGEDGPDPWRGADHGGACGSGDHRELSESDGSEDPDELRSAQHHVASAPFAELRRQAPGGKSTRDGQPHQGTRSVPSPE